MPLHERESQLEEDVAAPSDLVEVGAYASVAAGFERGLVALAAGAPYWLVEDGAEYRLMVEAGNAAAVREQLAKFERESAGWPPRPAAEPSGRRLELFTPLLWVLATLASFWAQALWPEWTRAGAMDARAVFVRGEVWRAATALALHADVGHLTANLVSGTFVFAAVLMTMGRRRGGGLLLAAAVAGNLAAAALQGAEYRSIGASTAVFAGLGLLTGRAVRVVASARPRRWRAMLVPLGAGLAVLALYGAGEQRVDVVAHVTGFLAGAIAASIGAKPAGGGPTAQPPLSRNN